jgi:hypothetical protein
MRRKIAQDLIEEYHPMKSRKYEKHLPWMAKWTKSANEDPLGVTSRKAANVPSDAYDIPEGIQVLELRIRATSATGANGKSGTLHLYLARKDDDISREGALAVTVGTQIATLNDANYVDTMVLTDRWITETHLADENGNNGMSRVAFDVVGYDKFFCRMEYSGDTVWYIDVSGFTN